MPDPYRVWLAEIMLQQTTVPHATRYYLAFTERWPTVGDLAAAKDEDVMAAWAGLGYYARARNLLKCARQIVADCGWPETIKGLLKLPGIGPYTAGAVGALAFGLKAAAVDGNVERVFSRLLATKGEWAAEKSRIRGIVEALVPADRPAEFAEGLMDLGATVCTPTRPNCLICPLREICAARAEGDPTRYPIKPKKAPKPTRTGHVYVLFDRAGNVLTERRPDKGLLGGMLGLPTSDWTEDTAPPAAYPANADWQEIGEVRHVFTHFALTLKVWHAEAKIEGDKTPHVTAAGSLPSVFAKALKLAKE
ncbi:MAG: A/G-specific adenine glycosylase [Henriciella sp.]